MKQDFLTPTYMAELYWVKLRRRAFLEIREKLAQFKTASFATREYWQEVHAILQRKASY